MRVRLYWNLNKDCVSVQCAATRKVIGYARHALISGVQYTVSESGRQRAVRDGQRNVHAFAVGELVAADWIENKLALAVTWSLADSAAALTLATTPNQIHYNPFRAAHFTNGSGVPVAASSIMYLTGTTKAECFGQ